MLVAYSSRWRDGRAFPCAARLELDQKGLSSRTQCPGTSQVLGAKTIEQIGREMENNTTYLELSEITYVKYILDI